MLILSRKKDEIIVIDGGRITIRVVEFCGSRDHERVRLGIEAPPDCAVDRLEIHEDKRRRAAGGPGDGHEGTG